MKITTRYVADYEFESENESGNKLRMDMYDAASKQHFSPMQMVLAAVGGCAAVDIVQMLKKKRKTVVDLKVEADGIRREEYPKKFTTIHIRFILSSPDTKVEDFEKVVKLAVDKYCSVSASLDPTITLTHEAVVENSVPTNIG